jgi:hypothetical protein
MENVKIIFQGLGIFFLGLGFGLIVAGTCSKKKPFLSAGISFIIVGGTLFFLFK